MGQYDSTRLNTVQDRSIRFNKVQETSAQNVAGLSGKSRKQTPGWTLLLGVGHVRARTGTCGHVSLLKGRAPKLGSRARPARPRRCFSESKAHHCSPWGTVPLREGLLLRLPPSSRTSLKPARSIGVLLCRSTSRQWLRAIQGY